MRGAFVSTRTVAEVPRLPLRGSIDLTYRCNNRCRHCWLRTYDGAAELALEEILEILDQARAMGCREWAVSGGEPMLRPDFPEIFEHLTGHSRTYTLNTNGTLITPEIALLMRRKGTKLISLYGATAAVHDGVTRRAGSFHEALRGMGRLHEAGAGFTVQLVPMQANIHEFEAMKALASSLSHQWRVGAGWLHLSAARDASRNREIAGERLPPGIVAGLCGGSPPATWIENEMGGGCHAMDDRLYACAIHRREFHIDPWGGLSFCSLARDPALRYDLRRGSFREGWDEFLPGLADRIRGGEEYLANCGSCDDRERCHWCPAIAYLEHGRHGAPVAYLCEISRSREARRTAEAAREEYTRHFAIGGMTVRVDADLPITDATFGPKFEAFRAEGPGVDTVRIHHHFGIPENPHLERAREVYRRPPWAVFRRGLSWIYAGIPDDGSLFPLHRLAVFSDDHSRAAIFNDEARTVAFRHGSLASLSMFPTDQVWLAPLLAERDGCILHSCGAVMDGKGLLFAGHSGAGKTTIGRLIAPRTRILCDDRNIVRRVNGRWRVYGTWSHGDLASVTPGPAPLHALLFIERGSETAVTPIEDPRERVPRILATIVRPLTTADWWKKTLAVAERMAREVPCYTIAFDPDSDPSFLLGRL